MSLVDKIKEQLGLTYLDPISGKIGKGGSISRASAYESNLGRIFVKTNSDPENAKIMFHGELEGLKALAATGKIRVPKPFAVIDSSSGPACLVAEFLQFSSLHKFQGQLGRQLAELHLHNWNESENKVLEFGFHVPTCCGKIPLDNSWNDNWVEFYCKQRLEPQINMALANSEEDNHELAKLWEILEPNIPDFFENITVVPSLLHGDLWSGNVGETDTEPVIFDPSSFYGHHEFDLAISVIFGGFTKKFYEEYHRVIPKQEKFEKRKRLYELFHYLNHWNHFGGGYRNKSLTLMRTLVSA